MISMLAVRSASEQSSSRLFNSVCSILGWLPEPDEAAVDGPAVVPTDVSAEDDTDDASCEVGDEES